MACYLREESNDHIVPNDQVALETPSMEDISPSPDDLCQWGPTRSENIGSPYKYCARSNKSTMEGFNFGRQNIYSKGTPVREGEGSSSSTCGFHSLIGCNSRTSEASFHGLPDFQLQNSMERMDDIFLNSFLEEDPRNMEDPLESLQNFPDSIYRSLPFDDFMTNMLIDPQNLMDPSRRESSTFMNACSFPLFSNDISEEWDKAEESSPSYLVIDEYKRSEGSPMVKEPYPPELVLAELSATSESEAVADVDEPKCLEATTLQDLEDVMIELSEKTRICVRDALYRLAKISRQLHIAKSSRQQHTINQNSSANFIDRPSIAEVTQESSRMTRTRSGESKSNAIDRTIANLMFDKPHCSPSEVSCAQSFHKSMEDPSASVSYYSWNQP